MSRYGNCTFWFDTPRRGVVDSGLNQAIAKARAAKLNVEKAGYGRYKFRLEGNHLPGSLINLLRQIDDYPVFVGPHDKEQLRRQLTQKEIGEIINPKQASMSVEARVTATRRQDGGLDRPLLDRSAGTRQTSSSARSGFPANPIAVDASLDAHFGRAAMASSN